MSDIHVINNHGLESRTSSSGKQRYVMVVKSEPLIFNADPKALGRPVAEAIVNHLRARIQGITEAAKPATIKARKVAERAYAQGKPWALKRFGGGRTGATPPNQTTRTFNDSGRFAKTISASASSDGAWRVNVAANRLTDDTSGGVARIWARLTALVPELQRPELMLQNQFVKRAIDKALADMVKKAEARTSELRVEMVKSLFNLVRSALGGADDVFSAAA